MPSNIRARFKGVKECSLCTKPTKVEQVWSALFEGEYKIPKCPTCRNPMYFREMMMNSSIAMFSVPRPLPIIGNPKEITIKLECLDCNLTIEGYAIGLRFFKNGDFTLEKIIVVNTIPEVKA